jgi:uncharacterized protein DUF6894
MALFYFCIQTDDGLINDEEGSELSGPDEARREAVEAAREIVAEFAQTGRELNVQAIVVTDGEGQPVLTVRFESVLPARLRLN